MTPIASFLYAALLAATPPVARIVPTDPLLTEVDAATGRMEFRVTGMDTNGCDIVAEVDGAPLGPMAEGRHELTVRLVSRKDGAVRLANTYPIEAKRRRSARRQGRRLNNFVAEVLSTPLVDGDHQFENPREGWVFIGFDRPYRDAKAFLDGRAEPIVEWRDGEPSETMRWLPEGSYTVRVAGADGGTLHVRLVKPLKITARTFANENTDIRIGRQGFGWDFFRRYLLHSFNSFTMGGLWRLASAEGRMAWGNAELLKRGKRLMAATDVRPGDAALRADFARMRGMFAESAAYRDGLALEMDENKVNAGHSEMDAFAEAVWELAVSGDPRPLYADFCDLPGEALTNLDAQVSSLAAIINTGRGHGMLVPEMYLGTRRTEQDMLKQEDRAAAYVRSLRAAMPSAPAHTIHLLGGWLTLGEWTSDSSCEADIRVLYDHYVRRLATDPDFADVGGLGMSTLACDEEVARWVATLVRHYCIEGRTDSLAERFGWRYRPEIVADGDFLEGFVRWTPAAAEPGGLVHERRHGYGGKKGQCRMARTTLESGEHFALFTRSAKGPNRLSQRLSGLVPGRLYKLTYATADYDDMLKPGGKRPSPDNLAATVSSAEAMPDLSWNTEAPTAEMAARAARKGAPPHCVTVTHRVVFRTLSPTADLVFDDSGAAAGVRTLLNYVSVAPYFETGAPGSDVASLDRAVADDLRAPVRPGGVGGQEFWNGHADWFMYPPSFAFGRVAGAARYRFTVIDDQHVVRTFEADSPEAALAPVWANIPVGFVSVRCDAVDASGAVVGTAGERFRFWKQAPYRPGAYPPAKRGYAEAARMVYDYIFMRPSTRYLLEHGSPDYSYSRNAYPSKMGAALIQAMLRYAKMRPGRAAEAMHIARVQADYLISVSQPADAPLAHFPPTYAGSKLTAKTYAGEIMLLYPASVASAYLELASATGDGKYRDAALGIARTYLRLQDADGTWPLKARVRDGASLARNRAFPMVMMELFMKVWRLTGDDAWRVASDRAFAFIERGPLADWNWEGQFEDVKPTEKFVNLTKHPACSTAMYLLARYPGDRRRLAQARELLRFSEDQFVCWERPSRPDGIGPRWRNEAGKRKWVQTDYLDWHLPGVMEQYHCYHPIDASAAKLIRTYLALYAATGNALDLAKAKTLGDAVVNVQEDDGRIPTHWNVSHFHDRDYDWINCMIAAADALAELDAMTSETSTKKKGAAK